MLSLLKLEKQETKQFGDGCNEVYFIGIHNVSDQWAPLSKKYQRHKAYKVTDYIPSEMIHTVGFTQAVQIIALPFTAEM